MLRGYEDSDPMTNKQPCLPLQILHHLLKNAVSVKENTIANLASGAVFFAMRSCEYLHTNKDPDKITRKTKLLRVRNFRFFKDNKPIDLYDKTNLQLSDCVIITFEFQKNRQKFESIKMNSNPSLLCPVKAWSNRILTILSYPKGSLDSPINLFRTGRSYDYITSKDMRLSLRSVTKILGEESLGFQASKVGTHSIQSTFAMLLILNKIPIETIMKLGRWQSLAVLEYIRANVDDFSSGISECIANASAGSFYTHPQFISSLKVNE